MTFRCKIALALVCLLALLFGGGSSALISLSFQSALAREQAAAKASYDQLLHTFQLVERVEVWSQPQDAVQVVQQLSAQGGQSWVALSLTAGEDVLLSQGVPAQGFLDLRGMVDTGHCAQGAFAYFDKHYLQLTGQLDIQGTPLLLNVAYDISPIYATRQQQQETFGKIFAVLLAVCALLSYTAARLLTRPLEKLAQTAQALAAGDLSCRSGITSRDEIGALAREFDAMAARQQEHITALQATMEGQDRFIGSFTHELKTPMTSILGYADLLRRGTLSPAEQAQAADYIFSEAKRLERLSLKLLDLYLAEHQPPELLPVSPAALLHDLTTPLRPGLAQQGITLAVQGEEGLCLLEPDLFRSLVLNLLDNARKAIEGPGTITASVIMTSQGCILTVQDTGRGIPPEVLDHLTEAFYRVDKSRARAQGGAGLGLTLCDKIAALHQGQLHLESQPGQGTTVTVTLKGGRPCPPDSLPC